MTRQCRNCFDFFDRTLDMCSHCGYEDGDEPAEALHLPPGQRLKDKYIIGRVLGYGGFGVTYLAWDSVLEQKVAIKEYLPSEFSTRVPGQTGVSVFGGDKSEQFYDGIEKFVEEAKRLAQFLNTDGIVRIFESFQENGTAYIVMEYLKGQTLTQYLEKSGPVSADEAIRLMTPIIQSLRIVHEHDIIHRDIAPDNIMVTDDGEVKLIDFGAARYATTSHSRSLTVVIKPGYSPEEQYRSRGDQGAWTDVYAVGATMYRMITGQTPPDAMERRAFFENKKKDLLTLPSKLSKQIDEDRETAILNAMNVRIEDRSADMTIFEQELTSQETVARRYGKIKKVDVLKWPLWAKIVVPAAACLVLVLSVLFATGVIGFDTKLKTELEIPQGKVRVPSIISKDLEYAKGLAEKEKLILKIIGKEESDEISADMVLFQGLSAGSVVNINTTLNVKISAGKAVDVTVKDEDGNLAAADVQYRTKDDAVKLLESQGMKVTFAEQSSETVAAGVVISQDPTAGTPLKPGASVKLIVSTGGAAFDMPNIEGQEVSAAMAELAGKGLSVQVEFANDANVPVGNVIRQGVAAGSKVNQGGVVIITVSSGKPLVQMPDVLGQRKNAAGSDLQRLGLQVSVSEGVSDKPKDEIIGQSPSAGASLEEGGVVAITVSRGQCKITLDAQGGAASQDSVGANVGGTVSALPRPERANYSFVGWFTQESGGSQVTAATTIEGDMRVYARWTQDVYTVSYKANGGKAAQTAQKVPGGQGISLPAASRAHYSFIGWFSAADGGSRVENGTAVNASMTLYARWVKTVYTVTYNANGGSVPAASAQVESGAKIGTLPTPTRKYYEFQGWYNGDSKISGSFIITGDITLVAQWERIAYTVTYNANGGSVGANSARIEAGETIGELPTPTRSYYEFQGWYSADTKADRSLVVTNDLALTARWTQKGVSDWVVASQAPAGSQIVEQKWTYSHTQSSTSSTTPSGYSHTNTSYGSWSGWSGWQNSSIGASADPKNSGQLLKEVRTQTVAATYKTQWNYWRYANSSNTSSTPTKGYNGWNTYFEYGWTDTQLVYKGKTASGASGYARPGAASWDWWYGESSRQVQVTAAYTQWSSRTRSATYTYKRDNITVSTQPLGSGVSNVVEYVRYRAK